MNIGHEEDKLTNIPPILVMIPSRVPIVAPSAGTNEPTWAMIAIKATIFAVELFPPMFGPVMILHSPPPGR